jgi:mannose-6-phosphate isomerase-like protein (cupin superfamily)
MLKFALAAAMLAAAGGTLASAQTADPPLARAASDPALQWGPCPPILPGGCQIAVLHGSPAEPNADIFLRVPGGYAIPPHRHTSAERMILVTGRLRVQYQGSPEATLEPGHYAYGPPGLPHRATCEGAAPCTLFIAFVGPVDAEAVAAEVE